MKSRRRAVFDRNWAMAWDTFAEGLGRKLSGYLHKGFEVEGCASGSKRALSKS